MDINKTWTISEIRDNWKAFDEWQKYCKAQGYVICSEHSVTQAHLRNSEEHLLCTRRQYLRKLREKECFTLLNRNYIINGKSIAWYDALTEEQRADITAWVQAWRDVTETLIIPEKPKWLS